MNPAAPIPAGPVTLRAWRIDEADLYLELRDPLVFRFTTEDPDLDTATCRANIDSAHHDPLQAPLAICDEDGLPVGNMAILRRGRKAILSYWMAEEARGRGWAAAALAAATDWAFATWPVDEAELEIDRDNEASVKVARAAGYLLAGMRLESSCGGPAHLYRASRTARAGTDQSSGGSARGPL